MYASMVILVLLIFYLGVNRWVEHLIEKKLNDLSNDKLKIEYKEIDVQLIKTSVTLDAILINRNEEIILNLEKFSLSGISLSKLFFNNKIEASDVLISKPRLKIRKRKEDSVAVENKSAESKFSIFIENVLVENGNLNFTKNNNKNDEFLSIDNFALKIKGLSISDQTILQKIPFAFVSHSSSLMDISIKIDEFHTLSIPLLKSSNEKIKWFDFSIVPSVSKEEFSKIIDKEQDYIKLFGNHLLIDSPEFLAKDNKPIFKANAIQLDSIYFNIYRDKRLPDDLSIKPMYSEMLREIRVGFSIDTTIIERSMLKYEEQPDSERNAGILEFGNLKARISKISNVENTSKVKAKFSAMYMNQAPIELDWSFDIMDTSNHFAMKGSIKKIKDESMNSFLVPVADIRADGEIDELYYNFMGNGVRATGAMQMRYDTFKVKEASDSSKSITKILTSVASLIISDKENEGFIKEDAIEVTRDQTKSFWNYFWLCIKNGIVKIIL